MVPYPARWCNCAGGLCGSISGAQVELCRWSVWFPIRHPVELVPAVRVVLIRRAGVIVPVVRVVLIRRAGVIVPAVRVVPDPAPGGRCAG